MKNLVRGGVVSFVASLSIGLHCSSRVAQNDEFKDLAILGLTVSYPFPLTAENATLVNDTVKIYYYGKYILYDMPNRYVRNGDVISTRMYFLYRKGESFGFKVDTLTDATIDPTKKTPKDQYLREVAYANEQLASSDSLVNVNEAILEESIRKYVMRRRPPDGLTFDTLYLHYTKTLTDFDYSLAPQFDTVAGTKLYKIQIAFHLNTFDSARLTLPASRFMHHELFKPKVSVTDKQRITTYIERQHKVLQDL